jgi:hypothetical protein
MREVRRPGPRRPSHLSAASTNTTRNDEFVEFAAVTSAHAGCNIAVPDWRTLPCQAQVTTAKLFASLRVHSHATRRLLAAVTQGKAVRRAVTVGRPDRSGARRRSWSHWCVSPGTQHARAVGRLVWRPNLRRDSGLWGAPLALHG